MKYGNHQAYGTGIPSDELIEDLDIFLQLFNRRRVLCIENGEGKRGCTVINVRTTWLDEAANEDDFKKSFCIF